MAQSGFGWTVVARGGDPNSVHVYKRDCPADEAHSAADLAPFTHPTRKAAKEAGDRGEYAYKKERPAYVGPNPGYGSNS